MITLRLGLPMAGGLPFTARRATAPQSTGFRLWGDLNAS